MNASGINVKSKCNSTISNRKKDNNKNKQTLLFRTYVLSFFAKAKY